MVVTVGTFLAVALTCVSAAVHKLPPSFKTCSRNMPNYYDCLIPAVENAVKDLRKGYQPLEMNGLDPLIITELSIDQGDGPVSINLNFKNLKIDGVSAVKLSNPNIQLENNLLEAKGYIPKLILSGQYTINGRVLILPITGNGPCKLVADDVNARFKVTLKDFTKGGKKYKKVETFDFVLDIKKLSIKLDNLFNGDKALGDNMNRFLNDNSQELLKELKPAIQEAFGYAFKDISNRMFTKVPIDEIFPK